MVIKFLGKLTVASLVIFWSLISSSQTSDISIKVIGVSYFEAPPNRDKNLALFGAGSSMEMLEVHAVATSANRLFVEIASPFEKYNITATAILADKTRLPLGSVDLGRFPKLSNDAKSRSITLKVNRLPDQPVLGVMFEGTLPVQVSKGLLKVSSKFEPRAGASFALGDIKGVMSKIDGQIITLAGDIGLTRLRSLAIKQADGRIIAAERHGYSMMNSAVELGWKFSAPPVAGTLEAEIYQAIDVVQLPIQLVIGKPF
jgi:hypothetical protein